MADELGFETDNGPLIEPGNIDLTKREKIPDPETGGVATVRSMSFEDDKGQEVLVPTAADGKILSNRDAIARYEETGEHLGKFTNPDDATAYALWLHDRQAQDYGLADPKTAARLAGYSWGEINGHIQDSTQQALAEGYTQPEVDAHLGYQDPTPLKANLTAAARQDQTEPLPDPPLKSGMVEPLELPEGLPQTYADALNAGQVKGPDDFAQHYAEATGSSPEAAEGLAASLPHPEDLIDHAIALGHGEGFNAIGNARRNLLDLWAQTGMTPQEVAAEKDPLLTDALTKAQPADHPTIQEWEENEAKRPTLSGIMDKVSASAADWFGSLKLYEAPSEEAQAPRAPLSAEDKKTVEAEGVQHFMGSEADPIGIFGFIKDLYNLPGVSADYDAETKALEAEGKDVSERWKDHPGVNFALDTMITGGVIKGAHIAARVPGALVNHPVVRDILRDESGALKGGDLTEALGEKEKTLEPSVLQLKDGKYQPVPLEAAQAEPGETHIKVGKEAFSSTDGGEFKNAAGQTLDEFERAQAKTSVAQAFDDTPRTPKEVRDAEKKLLATYRDAEAELRAASAGEASTRRSVSSPAQIQKALDAYDETRLTSQYQAASAELGAASEGGTKLRDTLPKEPTTRPTSVQAVQEAMEASDKALEANRISKLYEASSEELRAASEGGAKLPKEPTTRPTSVQAVQEAQRAYDEAHVTAQHQAASAELRAASEGGAKLPKEPTTRPTSVQAVHDAMKAYDEAREADLAKQERTAAARAFHSTDLPIPEGITKNDVTERLNNLDKEFNKLHGQADVDAAQTYRVLKAQTKEWRQPSFHNKVFDEIEARRENPYPEPFSDKTQQWLDANKPVVDRLDALRRREAELLGEDPDKVVSVLDGNVPRRVKGTMTPEGYRDRDPVTGVRTNQTRSLSTKRPMVPGDNAYVFEMANGERRWGGPNLETGEHKGSNFGDGWKSPEGELGKIKRASTPEIEANTDLRFRKSFTGNVLQEADDTALRIRHMEFIDKLKPELETAGVWRARAGQWKDEAPQGMAAVDLPQFSGWADPRIANALNDFHQMSFERGSLSPYFVKASRVLMASLFISPMKHLVNEAAHFVPSRGWQWVNPMGYGRLAYYGQKAMREIATMGPDYLRFVGNGGGLPYAATRTRNLNQVMLTKFLHEQVADQGGLWSGVAKYSGFNGVKAMVQAEYNASARVLWGGSDMMMLTRMLELENADKIGWRGGKQMPMQEAIAEAHKHMPSYQIPTEVMGSHAMSEFLKNPNYFVFGRYRYGQVGSLYNTIRDVVGTQRTPAERLNAIGPLLALGGMYYAQTLLGQYSGPGTLIHAAQGLFTGEKSYLSALGSWLTTSPLLGIENMIRNQDNFGKEIWRTGGTTFGNVKRAGEAAIGAFPVGQMLLKMLSKTGGTKEVLGQLLGWDMKEPVDQEKKAKFEKLAQSQALAAERKDDIETWLRNTLNSYGAGIPELPASGGGGRASGGGGSSGGGSGSTRAAGDSHPDAPGRAAGQAHRTAYDNAYARAQRGNPGFAPDYGTVSLRNSDYQAVQQGQAAQAPAAGNAQPQGRGGRGSSRSPAQVRAFRGYYARRARR